MAVMEGKKMPTAAKGESLGQGIPGQYLDRFFKQTVSAKGLDGPDAHPASIWRIGTASKRGHAQ
jgi:hypothetical protein